MLLKLSFYYYYYYLLSVGEIEALCSLGFNDTVLAGGSSIYQTTTTSCCKKYICSNDVC